MRHVWCAVKLEHDDLARLRAGEHRLQVIERPVRIRVTRGRDEERMMTPGIVGRPDFEGAVFCFGLLAPAREVVAQLAQFLHRLRAK